MARKHVVNIGDVSRKYPQLKVIKEFVKITGNAGSERKRRFVLVKCDICSKDNEMYGDGTFEISIESFSNGSAPCGCSPSHARSAIQWEVMLRRSALDKELEYRGYVGDWLGHKTKVTLYCEKHDYEYSTCTAGSLLIGTKCIKCATLSRAAKKTLKDSFYIDKWKESGAFPVGTMFTRLSARLWEVVCPHCPDETFVSDYSNLTAGKRPCHCTGGGGYNKALSGYVYILKIDGLYNRFTGFGISNFFNKRLTEHTRNLNKESLSITDSYNYFFEDGSIPRVIESAIKCNFPVARQSIEGFKTEATHYDLFLDVRDFVEDYIENIAK